MIKTFKQTKIFCIICGALLLLILSTCSLFPPPETLVVLEPETHQERIQRVLSSPQPRFPTKLYTGNDPVARLYMDRESNARVLAFYSSLTGSEHIARIILDAAVAKDVPVNLAFALAWGESRFKTGLASRNTNRSLDRGLFQLNSTSFPHLTAAEVYNPETNARYGLAYLHYCLSYSGNEVVALAMYNAGLPRVAKAKTPASTYRYIETILVKRDEFHERFQSEVSVL